MTKTPRLTGRELIKVLEKKRFLCSKNKRKSSFSKTY